MGRAAPRSRAARGASGARAPGLDRPDPRQRANERHDRPLFVGIPRRAGSRGLTPLAAGLRERDHAADRAARSAVDNAARTQPRRFAAASSSSSASSDTASSSCSALSGTCRGATSLISVVFLLTYPGADRGAKGASTTRAEPNAVAPEGERGGSERLRPHFAGLSIERPIRMPRPRAPATTTPSTRRASIAAGLVCAWLTEGRSRPGAGTFLPEKEGSFRPPESTAVGEGSQIPGPAARAATATT